MAEDPSLQLPPSPAGAPPRKTFRVLIFGVALLLVAPLVIFGACIVANAANGGLLWLPLVLAAGVLFLLLRAAWRAWKVPPEHGGEARWSILLGAALGTTIVLAVTLTGVFFVFIAGMGAPGRPLRDAKGRVRLPR